MAFTLTSETTDGVGRITLAGELDASVVNQLRDAVLDASSAQATRLVLDMSDLDFMASAGLRVLVFARQKMGSDVDIYIVGAHDAVLDTITMTGFHHSVFMVDEYDEGAS